MKLKLSIYFQHNLNQLQIAILTQIINMNKLFARKNLLSNYHKFGLFN